MARPRLYDFAGMAIGDRLVIALNGRSPQDVQNSVWNAAKAYARRHDPEFRGATDTTSLRGFVVFERIGGECHRRRRRIEGAEARVRRWTHVSRERSLSGNEIQSLDRAHRILARAAA